VNNSPSSSAESRDSCPTTERLVDKIMAFRDVALSADTLEKARIFLADTLAVGVAGRCEAVSDKVFSAAQGWSANGEGDVRILGRPDVRLSPHAAAVVNGTQIHCLEWDALHEPSVVIALCTTTAALISETETSDISLDETLRALVLGVETAVFFGAGSQTHPRFFRPSTAGLMGASVALAYLRKFTRTQMFDLLGLAYSQVSGTMQAHWEGSEVLPLQIGIAARAALTAADLAAAGICAPHDIIDGKFGYFSLIETASNLDAQFAQWAAPWKIEEVAHKPFPAGRATQATLTALIDLAAQNSFGMDDISSIKVHVPPLIMLLVGREYNTDMSAAYARLCMQFIAPMMIRDGRIDPRLFTSDHMASAQAEADAAKVRCTLDGNPDPNALSPQTIEIALNDGQVITQFVDIPYGSPGRPMDRADQIAKADFCFETAGYRGNAHALFEAIFAVSENISMRDVLDCVTN
jgi:2-methylcitrate dehydratase PrpD